MAHRTRDFQTIRSEGGLLPTDLLRRVLDPKEKLEGTRPEDCGLPQGERLNEVITQSRSRLRKHWAEFRTAAGSLPVGDDKKACTALRKRNKAERLRVAGVRRVVGRAWSVASSDQAPLS